MSVSQRRWVRRAECWLWDDMPTWMLPDTLQRPLLRALCLVAGHRAIDDQCGRPEHRVCYRCGKAMPYAARTPAEPARP